MIVTNAIYKYKPRRGDIVKKQINNNFERHNHYKTQYHEIIGF